MADINSYMGDAAIGFGQEPGGGELGYYQGNQVMDASNRFAMYNYYTQRDLWMQANKKKDEDAAIAAASLQFDYGQMMPTDRAAIDQAYQNFTKYFQEHPNAVRYRTNSDGTNNAAEFSEFQKLRNEITNRIRLANGRRSQMDKLDGQIQQMSDPKQRAKAQEWKDQQIQKGYTESIDLFPNFQLFDMPGYVAKAAGDVLKWDQIKRNPNDTQITSYGLTNVSAAVGRFDADYSFGTAGVRDEFDAQLGQYNEILARNKDENGKVNLQKLAKDKSGMGQSIINMLNASNGYLNYYNSDAVQKQVPGATKVSMINIDDDLDATEYFKMVLSSKLTASKEEKVQQTDNQIQADAQKLGWANLNARLKELDENKRQFEETKGAEFKGGDVGNLAWYNVARTASTATPNGVLLSGQGLENAFSRETDVIKTITTMDEDGNEVQEKVKDRQTPVSLVVKPDPLDPTNKNKFQVLATYEGRTPGEGSVTKTFDQDAVYDAMQFINGPKDATKVADMNAKFRMKVIGSNKPDFDNFRKHYEGGTDSGKTFTIRGVKFTRAALEKSFNAHKKPGETLDQFIKRINK